MKAMVEQKGCIRCGLCASLCPAVFSLSEGESAQAVAGEVPDDAKIGVQEAADSCPVAVIHVTE